MIRGIDVSDNNGYLDWDSIKADNIDFAFIRIGYGSNYESQDDRQAVRNMEECERLGIPYGVYIYSYALNETDAESEVAHILRMAKGHNPALGFYYDMEDADGYKVNHGLNPYENGDILTNFCNIFADRIKEFGYESYGTYANMNYFNNVLGDVNGLKWLAIWGIDSCPVEWAEVWQYSSDGIVSGNGSSRMDMNYYINEEHFNELVKNINSNDYSIEDPIPEKPIENVGLNYHIGDLVSYNKIYSSSGDWTDGLTPYYTEGEITAVYEGARHPYLIGNGVGFVDDNCIINNVDNIEPIIEEHHHVIGETVTINGIYYTSSSEEKLTPSYNEATITYVKERVRNPYLIDNGAGWINDSVIVSCDNNTSNNDNFETETETEDNNSSIDIGSIVRFTGSQNYNGINIIAWHNDDGYTVKEINGDRIVLYYNDELFDAVNINDVELI